MADGSVRYRWLGIAPASPAWTRFAGRFTTPVGAAAVTVLQSLTAVGWVEIDDVDVHRYTESAFARPLVSVTFDDGYAAHATVALPELRARGMVGTFYVTAGDIGAEGLPRHLSADDLRELAGAGMEIGSHSVTHPDLTLLDDTALDGELVDSRRVLRDLTGQSVTTFAAPFGTYDDRVRARIAEAYATHRSVDDGINERHTLDLTRIRAKLVLRTTTDAEVQEWLDETRARGLWLVLVFHDLVDPPGDLYDTTPERFRSALALVAASGLPVLTVGEASEEVRPQGGTM
jgi:peptidoglycan/xylan/chitin deacetylase (PgdA/CDA1 family)